MEKIDLTNEQNGIIMALLNKRQRAVNEIDGQLAAFVDLLCTSFSTGEGWRLVGSPQSGFSLVPPERSETEEVQK